jgi:hypothetical protein
MKGSDTMKQCFEMKFYKKAAWKFGKKISLKFALVQLITHMPIVRT